MSGILDKAADAVGGNNDQSAQGGDNIERSADNAANTEINDKATDAGIPKGADSTIDKVADSKINDEIPGGN
ncbi:hypothetical protein K491DRAFT_713290 [Lophiostoma macrostomum CBS 122681]|uniref:Uncharacterized protein n=1 Tax=Lophiostoma macrostomum CBS 122681 TaxID=1314788 RepID=A0A6A6TJN6_9PLEO|nr:hypothetical protein K491DRAFT_713290 [Lophiostoma macrostomum CBS 122681]